MAVRYPCGECGKEFNFRIKLNRHIKTIHKELSSPSEDYFLKPDAVLTVVDKIKYFDKLKEKFEELSSKFSNTEKKFEYLQRKLKSLEKIKCKSKKSEQSKKFVGAAAANASGLYEKIENDPNIPAGWQSSYKPMDSSFGKDKKIKVYWAPNGRFFSSRREAVNYMITELESTPADLEVMRKGFFEDGWLEDGDSLPERWLHRVDSDAKRFLTDDYILLKGSRAVLKYMAAKNADDEIGKFICKYSLRSLENASNISWMLSDSIPFPWRFGNIIYKSGVKSQIITSPDGQVFNCLKTAVDFIEKYGDMEKKDLESFVNFVGKAKYQEKLTENDWILDTTLPEGWRKMKKGKESTRYLSPSGETFGTRSGALDYLRKYEGIEIFDQKVVKKEKLPKLEKIVKRERSELDWQFDDSVPENWSTAAKEGGVVRFKDPKGAVFSERPVAIKSMLTDTSCTEEDIELMKNGLAGDGWIKPDFLPIGWLMKHKKRKIRGKSFSNYTQYLTPQFDILQVFETVFQHLKKSGCSEAELMTFKEQCHFKWRKGDFLPEGWMYSVIKHYQGKSFKVYLSPSGRYFSGVLPVMRHYQDSFENSSDKNLFISLMFCNGWFTTEYLPSGWMCKPKNHKGGMLYVSPEYILFKNTKKLITFMEKQGIDPEVISTFRRNWKNLISTSSIIDESANTETDSEMENDTNDTEMDNDSNDREMENDTNNFFDDQINCGLSWTTDPKLPKGWKSAVSEIAKGPLAGRKCYRFMSSDGNVFGSRIEAFKAIVNDAAADMEEIKQFKKGFAQEGWKDKMFLPENWLMREQSSGSSYMTPTGEVLASCETVLTYMIENEYSPEEIDNFNENSPEKFQNTKKAVKQEPLIDKAEVKKAFKQEPPVDKPEVKKVNSPKPIKQKKPHVDKAEAKKVNIQELLPHVTVSRFKEGTTSESKSNYEWKPDNTLPSGWKSTLIESALGSIKDMKFKRYLSPEGRILGSRPQALRYMTTNSSFTEKDIDEMKKGLPEEGWLSRDFLPSGWFIKKLNHGSCIVLTNLFETLKSIRKVVSYMELKEFRKDEIEKVKEGITNILREIGLRRHFASEVLDQLDIGQKRKAPDTEVNNATISPSGTKRIKANRFTKGNADEDWTPGDETLPEGWKIRMNKSLQVEQYLSTKKSVFLSRAEALKFMCANAMMYTPVEVEEIKTKLQYEFWEDHHLMPEGWKLKKIEGGAVFFLTEIGSFIRTIKGARDNIKKRNSEMELKSFDTLLDVLKPINREHKGDTVQPLGHGKTLVSKHQEEEPVHIKKEPVDTSGEMSNINIKKEKDLMDTSSPSLPTGWTQKIFPGSDDIVFTSPAGKTLSSRLAMVEFLIKSKSDPQTIYSLWSTLDLEGWILGDELLPPGWRMKFHKRLFDYKYLTREMTVLNSSEEACKHITESGDYTQENLKNFKDWFSEVKKATPLIKWESDNSLPSDWKMASGLEFEIIKDTKGALFDSRKEAIDHMIKEHYSPTDIFNLWNTLHLEGWINDEEHLPTGWKRKFYPEKNTHHYLSPMMEVVNCAKTLLEIVKKGREYTEEEVSKVEMWMKNNE